MAIRSKNFYVGKNSKIEKDVEILCPDFRIGNNVYIGKGSKISCRNLEVGNDTFIQGDVLIEGALNNLETKVKIGNGNLICQGTRINCNYPVVIGNNVGIGQNVRIWTHGYFLDRLKGYPYNVGKVRIGNNVWLIEGSVVMPGVTIGNDIIIGTNSLVDKDIPSGCFAVGQPVKIKREKIYPKEVSYEDKTKIIKQVVSEYAPIMEAKGFSKDIGVEDLKIYFDRNGKTPAIFNCRTMRIKGNLDGYGEDFRDYLRRNSIRFFNGTPFKSILFPDFRELMEENIDGKK